LLYWYFAVHSDSVHFVPHEQPELRNTSTSFWRHWADWENSSNSYIN